MYGKLFEQMFDGTLATKGPWQALVTFQQLIILADQRGIVDMTIEAIARRTTIPIDILQVGIVALEQVDPDSRTPTEDGRRIVRLSETRDWGWRIVNHSVYRKIRSQEERREYMRLYQQKRRAEHKPDVNIVSNVNQEQYAVSNKKERGLKSLLIKKMPTPRSSHDAEAHGRAAALKALAMSTDTSLASPAPPEPTTPILEPSNA